MTAAAYFIKMKGFVDETVVASKPLEDEDFIAYLLTGLDYDYNSFIENVSAKVDPILVSDVYAQFLVAEFKLELQNMQQQATSMNATMHGGRTGGNRRDHGGDSGYRGGYRGGSSSGGGRGGFGRGYGGRGEQRSSSNKKCQLCDKEGHTVHRCWKRFDHNYRGEERFVNAAGDPSYGVDTAWYGDSAAIDHVTGALEKLNMREQYHGQEQIHTADGLGMHITHIGNSIIPTPSCDIHLKKVLHVPHTSKNIITIHRLTYDNNVSIEFRLFSFLIKDRATRKIILWGR
jgi:hypothetical protein